MVEFTLVAADEENAALTRYRALVQHESLGINRVLADASGSRSKTQPKDVLVDVGCTEPLLNIILNSKVKGGKLVQVLAVVLS